MASKLKSLPRGARYWLKDNSLEYFYPKMTKEQFKRRESTWEVRYIAGLMTGVCCGTYCTLRYLWPNTFTADFPMALFFQFEWDFRSTTRAVKPRTEPRE